MSEMIRLDKFISSQKSNISRNDVKSLCKKGLISVNEKTIKSSSTKVCIDDIVMLSDEKIEYKKYIYIMLNKPKGYVCSTKDGESPTVLELLPDELRRKGIFPAGRLDKDTEGFVFITNDGELAHKMLSPKKHVTKKYYVELLNPYEESYKDIFNSGMTIDGNEKLLPAEIEFLDNNKHSCYVYIKEGKYHQIKRMFKSVNNEVTYLKRLKIGSLELDENLELGAYLEVLHKDVENLLA